VHVHVLVHRAVNWDGLRAVSFLSIKFSTLTDSVSFNYQWGVLASVAHVASVSSMVSMTSVSTVSAMPAVTAMPVIWWGNYCLPSWVETKISLVHQLLIERCVYSRVIICNWNWMVHRLVNLANLCSSVFKKLAKNWFLLLITLDVHPFSLNCIKLMFAATTIIVISRRVPWLHTLTIFGSIRKGE